MKKPSHLIIALLLSSGLALQGYGFFPLGHPTKKKTKKVERVEQKAPPATKQKVAKAKPAPLKPPKPYFKVLIDPGHGGKDKGAKGFGLFEKDLVLKVSTRIVANLAKSNANSPFIIQPSLTRFDDSFVKLRERAKIANRWNADLFVSVHANWSPAKRARGYEVYFLSAESSDEATNKVVAKENAGAEQEPAQNDVMQILNDVRLTQHVHESAHFAESMYNSMLRSLKPNVRGVRQGPFAVLSGTRMPAVLVEIGYVSNRSDANRLANEGYLKRMADAISGGIRDYIRSMKRLG